MIRIDLGVDFSIRTYGFTKIKFSFMGLFTRIDTFKKRFIKLPKDQISLVTNRFLVGNIN